MNIHKVIALKTLTDHTFILRLERNGLQFQAGQFVVIRRINTIDQREYSIYSGEHDKYLEVLVREVNDGKVTPRLRKLQPGDKVEVDGPFGFFRFQPHTFSVQKFLFIATGTGISPFHSFIRTYPGISYQLVHGVRYSNEAYEHAHFNGADIILCTTGDRNGTFNGRVTDYLAQQEIEEDTQCFLCGNSNMIQEAFDLLTSKGIPVQNIYTEVYF